VASSVDRKAVAGHSPRYLLPRHPRHVVRRVPVRLVFTRPGRALRGVGIAASDRALRPAKARPWPQGRGRRKRCGVCAGAGRQPPRKATRTERPATTSARCTGGSKGSEAEGSGSRGGRGRSLRRTLARQGVGPGTARSAASNRAPRADTGAPQGSPSVAAHPPHGSTQGGPQVERHDSLLNPRRAGRPSSQWRPPISERQLGLAVQVLPIS
jgi:hypothetical protein